MLTQTFEAFAPVHHKMEALSIFSKICQKCVLFRWYFVSPQTSGICFIIARKYASNAMKQWQIQVTQTFTLHLLKMLPHHFRYFYCSNFKMTFDKNFLKSYHFLTSSKRLICRKLLRFGNRWHLMVTEKTLRIVPKISPKKIFLVYVNFRYMKYLIFAFSSACANCCFSLLMHNLPKWSDKIFKVHLTILGYYALKG